MIMIRSNGAVSHRPTIICDTDIDLWYICYKVPNSLNNCMSLGQYDTLMQELMRESRGDFKSYQLQWVIFDLFLSHPSCHVLPRKSL